MESDLNGTGGTGFQKEELEVLFVLLIINSASFSGLDEKKKSQESIYYSGFHSRSLHIYMNISISIYTLMFVTSKTFLINSFVAVIHSFQKYLQVHIVRLYCGCWTLKDKVSLRFDI